MEKKKILIPIFLILLVGIIACIPLLTGNKKNNDTPKKDIKEVYTTIIISINPKLALEIDKDKNVINMYPLNKDAEEFNRNAYVGKTLDESIEQVMTDAKDYIKDNKEISISVADESKDNKHIEEIKEIKKDVIETFKEKDTTIEVKDVELTKEEVKEIIDDVEEIKVEDKKEDKTTTTSTTTSTTTTSTTTSTTSKKTTTTKKKTTTTTKKKTTSATTKKPDYNLNDNIKIEIVEGDLLGIFVYPNKDECKGKFPGEVTIPEGQTYNSYCENKIPSQPKLTGKGYYCETVTTGMINEDGVTSNKPYMCYWIEDIIPESKVISIVEKVLKKPNAVDLGGGLGGVDEVTLDEATCKKFSLSCGRW